jgi:hypothetical protein
MNPLAFRILINMHVLSAFRSYMKMITPKAALFSLSVTIIERDTILHLVNKNKK